MQSLDSLKVVPVWVDPAHMVESARVLMDGHDLSALCVLDRNGRPIGTLRRDVSAAIPGNARVGEVMEPVLGILDANESLRQAADLLVRIDRHYAPMMRGDEFLGIVTALNLLDGLRRSWDPMTDLPWSDELRRWGAEKLEGGREIAVIFIDLDRFGSFNKRFGHVVGDRVLARMAGFLRERTDSEQDVLVRYGGDEFAIGTLRSARDTQRFADELLTTSRQTPLTESGEPIMFSVGLYGGQRQRERDDMHVQATLDDLINLASRRCLASKPTLVEASQSGRAVVADPVEPIDPAPPAMSAPAETMVSPVEPAPQIAVMPDLESSREESPESPVMPEAGTLETPVPAFMARLTPEATIPATETVEEPVLSDAVVDEIAPEASATEAAETSPEPGFLSPIDDTPSVVEVQIEDDPNSLTHVVLKGGGRVWVGVGLRLGRTVESTVAYATGKALERAYTGRILKIDATRNEDGQVVIEGVRLEDGEETPVRMVATGDSPEAVADATIAAFLA